MKGLFTILIFVVTISAIAQDRKSGEAAIENLIEEIAQNSDEELDYSQIIENLYLLMENPLNLNFVTEEELEQIPVLNVFQIKNILNYTENFGPFQTIYELQLIEGFDIITIKKILPFVYVGVQENEKPWQLKPSLQNGRHMVLSRVTSTIEKPVGFLDDNGKKYKGNRIQFLNKYRYNYRQKLRWGLTTEKDPGEEFFRGSQKSGFDFYSAYLQVNDLGFIKNVIVGDYQLLFGQGLIMWSYISHSKSSLVLDTRRRATGIKPYSSVNENSFLRGSAATLSLGKFSVTAFSSYKNIDANIVADTLTGKTYFTSFKHDGIHATQSQLDDKDAIGEFLIGANIGFRSNHLNLGVTGLHNAYNHKLVKTDVPENKFLFNGDNNQNYSFDFQYKFRSIHFFGESAISKNGGKAIVTGAQLQLASQFNTSIVYRNYEKNFQAQYGNAFGERPGNQNEKGFYVGAEILPYKKWKISAYYDFYEFPWLLSSTNSPSDGNDFLMQVNYSPARNLDIYMRFKQEKKDVGNTQNSDGIQSHAIETKSGLRLNLDYIINNYLKLRNRLELSKYELENGTNEIGYFIFQDVVVSPEKYPLKLYVRYGFFDTDSYASRIYSYESDVYQGYSIPAFYDKGTRTYLLLQYSPIDRFDVWFRISQTYYANKVVIGSGLNQISGHVKSDIRVQVRYKF